MHPFEGLDKFTIIAAFVVGVLSVARTARLITFDDFPPMMWLRTKILVTIGPDSKWAPLLRCPFCLSPYLMAVMVAWAFLSDFHWTWWLLNGWWATSYVAAMVVAYDEPPEQ